MGKIKIPFLVAPALLIMTSKFKESSSSQWTRFFRNSCYLWFFTRISVMFIHPVNFFLTFIMNYFNDGSIFYSSICRTWDVVDFFMMFTDWAECFIYFIWIRKIAGWIKWGFMQKEVDDHESIFYIAFLNRDFQWRACFNTCLVIDLLKCER